MPCGLFFGYIRARLGARKRLRQEGDGANDSKPTKNSDDRKIVFERDETRPSILDKLVKKLPTFRSELGMSAPQGATLSDSDSPRFQSLQRAPEEPIDPTKSYLTRVPRELKLEIIDHICSHPTAFVKDPTEVAFSKRSTLSNLRLTCRELANLAAPSLFQQLRLTDDLLGDEDQRKEFLKHTLPLIAPHVRLLWLWFRLNCPDEDIAAAVSLLQHVTWLSLCIESEEGGSKTLAALMALPDLQKLTLRIPSSYDGLESTIFESLIGAHSKRITALYLHFDWTFMNGPSVFTTIRDKLPRLTTLHVVAARGSSIDTLLLDDKPWACQGALSSIHFQELIELEASLVPKMVDRFQNLTHLVVSSCGPFGTYGDAHGREDALETVMQKLPKVQRRRPLEGLRIVHFTDMEARLMSPTPTVELVVNDPLDQMLFGPLLMRDDTFPGLRKLTLEYIDDKSGEARALLVKACKQRGVELVRTERERDVPR